MTHTITLTVRGWHTVRVPHAESPTLLRRGAVAAALRSILATRNVIVAGGFKPCMFKLSAERTGVGRAAFPALLLERSLISRSDLSTAQQHAEREHIELAEALVALGVAAGGHVLRRSSPRPRA